MREGGGRVRLALGGVPSGIRGWEGRLSGAVWGKRQYGRAFAGTVTAAVRILLPVPAFIADGMPMCQQRGYRSVFTNKPMGASLVAPY